MTPHDQKGRETYFAASRSWAEDRLGTMESSRRSAWVVAGIAMSLALLEALALVLLLPLKTAVPYTVMVDRQTGYVQALDPKTRPQIAANDALTKSMLAQYVTARESFDVSELALNYRKVGLWSAETARADYLSALRPGNPNGPLAIYPRSTVIEAQIKSVSSIGPQVVLVRFDTVRRDLGGASQPALAWASVVRYRFSDGPMSVADRFDNPLGFQVVRYHRDAEVVPAMTTGGAGSGSARKAVAQLPPLTIVPQPVAQLAPKSDLQQRTVSAATSSNGSVRLVDSRSVPLGSPLGPMPSR